MQQNLKLKKLIINKLYSTIQIKLIIQNQKKYFKKLEKLIKFYLIQNKEKYMI